MGCEILEATPLSQVFELLSFSLVSQLLAQKNLPYSLPLFVRLDNLAWA
jgi:hypothetical protein